jgi:hypothetical protein
MRGAAILLAALALVGAGRVEALTVEDLSVGRAVALADVVVLGEVVDQRVLLGPGGNVHTDSTVRVERTIAGAALGADMLVVRHLGGVLPDLASHVEGMPTFAPGERVLLLLARRNDGATFHTVGAFLGAYTVVDSPAGAMAVQKPSGGSLILGARPADRLPERMLLDDLAARIEAAAGRRP